MKIFTFLVLICYSLLFVGCVMPQSGDSGGGNTVEHVIPIMNVKHVVVNGAVHVMVMTGVKRGNAAIKLDDESSQQLEQKIVGDTLTISTSDWMSGSHEPVVGISVNQLESVSSHGVLSLYLKSLNAANTNMYLVKTDNVTIRGNWGIPAISLVGVQHLNAKGYLNVGDLTAEDSTDINFKGLHCSDMSVQQSGSGNMILLGSANIKKILQSGDSVLEINRLNARNTTVRLSGNSHLKIAGHARLLTAHVTGRSMLQARYLEARDIYIKSFGSAQADVRPTHKLFAYASGGSAIRYYGDQEVMVQSFPEGAATILSFSEEGGD